MTMQNIKFEDLMSVLKNDDNTPFIKYTVEDYDGNQIRAEDLYVIDYHRMKEWLVDSVCINEFGHAIIVLNSGNFKNFHFKNVQ